MTYEAYIAMNRDDLLKKLKSVVPKKRLRHMIGVEKASIYLAEINGYDTEKAGLAGLLHDYAKASGIGSTHPEPCRRTRRYG